MQSSHRGSEGNQGPENGHKSDPRKDASPADTASDQTRGPIGDNAQKDPSQWVTGDEPMTGAQKSYLHTLSQETNQQFDDTLTKAQASERIDELRKKDPRVNDDAAGA